MSTEIIVASTFTLLGVFITVLAGFLTQRLRIRGEIRRVRYEVLETYAQHLERARLDAYPKVYRLLSTAVKQIDFPDAFPDTLEMRDLERAINDWDSRNGFLLTVESGDRSRRLRTILRGAVENPGEHLPELREALVALEVALRVDLGIYALEFARIERGFRRYGSVSDTWHEERQKAAHDPVSLSD